MDKFLDQGFLYHRAMAQIWALLILQLSDREILPFDFEAYATAIKGYVTNLDAFAKEKGSEKEGLVLDSLYQASEEFSKNAEEFHAWGKAWEEAIGEGAFESNVMAIKRMSHNSRMANFETNLLDVDGGVSNAFPFFLDNKCVRKANLDMLQLPGREQFVHVLFAPQIEDSYRLAIFPGVRDAIDAGNWTLASEQVEKAAKIISYASRKLIH